MIKSIWKIGNAYYQDDPNIVYSSILEDPKADEIIEIIIDTDSKNIEYNHHRQFPLIEKYVYKTHKSNTPNYTLTFVLTISNFKNEGEINKFKRRLILEWIKSNKDMIEKNEDLKKMCELIKENIDNIINYIKEKIREVEENKKGNKNKKSKTRFLISFCYKKNGKIYYAEDYYPKKKVLDKILENMKKYGKNNGKCILCGKENCEIYGNVLQELDFLFYTVNQKGFAPLLDNKKAYKRFPICKECALKLIIGKKKIESLDFQLKDNIRYMIIPEIMVDDPKIMRNMYELFIDCKMESEDDFYGLLSKEDLLFKRFKKVSSLDLLKINILIYERNRQKFQIHRILEDLEPSNLSKIEKSSKKEIVKYRDILSLSYNINGQPWWVKLLSDCYDKENERFTRNIAYVLLNKKLPLQYYIELFLRHLEKNKMITKDKKNNKKNFEREALKTICFLEFTEVI